MNTAKKITAATFKSFVRNNAANLQINVKSAFDGMTDGCEPCKNGFKPAKAYRDQTAFIFDAEDKHSLGASGIWLVGQSRDWFQAYNQDGMTGIEVSNCCGRFIVAIPAADAAPTAPEAPPAVTVPASPTEAAQAAAQAAIETLFGAGFTPDMLRAMTHEQIMTELTAVQRRNAFSIVA